MLDTSKTIEKKSYGVKYGIQVNFKNADESLVADAAAIVAADRYHLRRFNLSSMSPEMQEARREELQELNGTVVEVDFNEVMESGGESFAAIEKAIKDAKSDEDKEKALARAQAKLDAQDARIRAMRERIQNIK